MYCYKYVTPAPGKKCAEEKIPYFSNYEGGKASWTLWEFKYINYIIIKFAINRYFWNTTCLYL